MLQIFDLFPEIDDNYSEISRPLPLYALYISHPGRMYSLIPQDNIKFLTGANMGQNKVHLFYKFQLNCLNPLDRGLLIEQVVNFIRENFSSTNGVFIFDSKNCKLYQLNNLLMRHLLESNSLVYTNIESMNEMVAYDPFVRSGFADKPLYIKDIFGQFHRVIDVYARKPKLHAEIRSGYSNLLFFKYTLSTGRIVYEDATPANLNKFLTGVPGIVNSFSERRFNTRR